MKSLSLILLILFSINSVAQESANGISISCKHGEIGYTVPQNFHASKLKISQTPSSAFIPNYNNVPSEAQSLIKEALDIWSLIIISKTAIKVNVFWEQLNTSVLATTGTEKVYKNFKNAPLKEVWYPTALANAISGERLNASNEADIMLRINSSVNWNLNNSIYSAGSFDLVSVVLHEIAHGLGFMTSFEENSSNQARWGIQNLPLIYDKFLSDLDKNQLTNNRFYNNNSQRLLDAITANKVFFAIDSGYYSSIPIQIHTVNPYRLGASLSHISNQAPLADPNDALMFSSLPNSRIFRFPGNATLAILFQLGWALNFYEFDRKYPEDLSVAKLSLYPNPSQNSITLETHNIPETEYRIIDFQGREIKKGALAPLKTEISISNLSPGQYILKAGKVSSVFLKN